ncbi:MAG: hypothetical protein CL569_18115 [Alphaproteobacteria bacterium]|nr:hypothetical protein [Alphaproteobacteria bacterium]|tara:strand:- start:687 stop:932 length:246 start_codon:yes stop_codon:yes gene_type:complete
MLRTIPVAAEQRQAMPRILVIVPAPVSGQQLELRKAQVGVAALPDDVEVDFRAVRTSADNQVSHHDYALKRNLHPGGRSDG